MTQFRKKLVVIEATQWFKNGDHPEDGTERFPPKTEPLNQSVKAIEDGSSADPRYTGEFAGELFEGRVVRYFRRPDVSGETACRHCGVRLHEHGWIDTMKGGHIVCPGDWVITGVEGDRYPCKPDLFELLYEPVSAL